MSTNESQVPVSFADFCWEHARRRSLDFEVVFAQRAVVIHSLEGPVSADMGDAIITGISGERWPIPADKFSGLYEPRPPTRMGEDGRYRRLPVVVSTSRLKAPLSVALTGVQGVLSGKTGDWLVQHPDGSLGIVADQVFQQTYELML